MPVIFHGNERFAYRDPACYYDGLRYHLFFTVSEKADGYLYNRVGYSASPDLKHFTPPVCITERDRAKNFCSPGNVVCVGGEYLICVTSYPLRLPYAVRDHADDTARLFFIRTKDFESFSAPERIYPKGEGVTEEGRMIDPFLLEANGEYRLFFKQNGVSVSRSRDLVHWEFLGRTDGGENACVLREEGRYVLLHSPKNGIGVKESDDLAAWRDVGVFTVDDEACRRFASGRLTAAFAMQAPTGCARRYAVFFHGSRAECPPETHGAATLALAFTDDFRSYFFA